MRADISIFESIYRQSNRFFDVFNSQAASTLQSYDQTRKGAALCDKYIKEMQEEDYVPADLISQMYQAKEQYDTQLMSLKQELMEQASKEPLDAFDREVFMGLSEESQADLQSVLKADEVFRRALEMKEEAAAEVEAQPEVKAEPQEKEAPKESVAEEVPEETESEESAEANDLGDFGEDFAMDVSSEEEA